MTDWEEARLDIIGQNGNTGEHYEDVEWLKAENKRLNDALNKALIDAELYKEEANYWREAYFLQAKGILENIKARNAD